jgi:hypothetical protein
MTVSMRTSEMEATMQLFIVVLWSFAWYQILEKYLTSGYVFDLL